MTTVRPCCLMGHPLVAKPQGTVKKIAGHSCYVVGDETSSKVVMLAPDVFGLSPHFKTLADHFSLLGYQICAVDIFSGTAMSPGVLENLLPVMRTPGGKPRSFLQKVYLVFYVLLMLPYLLWHGIPFMWRHSPRKPAPKEELVTSIAKELVKQNKQVYLVGYCYGGTISLSAATKADSPFSACAEAHGQVTLEKVNSLKKPFLFCTVPDDHSFPEKMVTETEKIIAEKYPKGRHRLIRYPGTYHGFAIRGDDSDTHIAHQKDKCMHDVIEFFNNVHEQS